MIRFVLNRAAQAALTLVAAVSLIFVAIHVLPGNPLLARFGQRADPEQIARIREQQGWNRPLHEQLGSFLHQALLRGDWGVSIARSHERVADQLRQRVPATMELAAAAMALAFPLGLGAGVAAAWGRNRLPDYACMALALVGVSVPVFFLGLCLREMFPGLPTSQRLPKHVFDFEAITGFMLVDTLLRGRPDLWLAAASHLCLPAAALATIPLALIARVTRGGMVNELAADYVRAARAKGASWWRVVWRHALPNAAPPIANITGFQVGTLLSGAVLTETVFDWPGLGKYTVDAVLQNDYAVVQAGAIFIAALFIGVNWLLDVVYVWLDPRIRVS